MKYLLKTIMFLSLLAGGKAWAITLNFDCITLNDVSGQSCSIGEAQMSVEVLANATMGTDFIFSNVDSGTPENPKIHEIYFDAAPFTGIGQTWLDMNAMITAWTWPDPDPGESGFELLVNPAPPNLPAGNPIGFDSDFAADAGNDNQVFGEGHSLTINIKALEFSRFLSALNGENGEWFDIGLHIGSLVDGESESFVSVPAPIPLPASVWLFGSALIGFIGYSRRRMV